MRSLNDQTKAAFRQSVGTIRTRLLSELAAATDQRYSLGARDRSKIRLSHTDQTAYRLLKSWLTDPARSCSTEGENLAALVKERAYTLVNRLVILMQLESRNLRSVRLISRGLEKSAFRDYRDFFAALTECDDRGYRFLLQQVWDELALELPALFAWDEVQECIPIPGPTLIWLLETLSAPELTDAWVDDTTLGWLYQYWNDPDRKAVDDKLNTTTGKVEAGELANKTQLFTERYMVEWLVQNSLGAQWLAICTKNGWEPEALGVIAGLRKKREALRNALPLSPQGTRGEEGKGIETGGAEEFWKYYVEQDLAPETVAAAPSALAQVRILDPAMGSGHFLVYAFDFLWELYRDEARLRGVKFSAREVVDLILGKNLHGIDIDNRAVQIAAAAIYLKTQERLPGYQIRRLNLVATDLGLAHIGKNDPALSEFTRTLESEAGLQKEVSLKVIESLKGAEYMGSLLRIDEEIRRISELYGERDDDLSSRDGLGGRIMSALKRFIHDHDSGEDLGLRSLAEQLGKGLRLIEILGQSYDVVVANPPYLGLSKMNDTLAKLYAAFAPIAKGDMSTLFMINLERLAKPQGYWCFVAQHNWMFLGSFKDFREQILKNNTCLRTAHLGSGAFEAISGEVVGSSMHVFQKGLQKSVGRFQRLVSGDDPNEKMLALVKQARTYTFPQSRFAEIPGSPMIYWWPEEFRKTYLISKKLAEVGEVKQGLATANNDRYTKLWHEVLFINIDLIPQYSNNDTNITYNWQPYIKGSSGNRWYESLSVIVSYKINGLMLQLSPQARYGRGATHYFRQGLAFSYIGTNGFLCRLRKYKSIFDVSGSSIFCENPEKMQVLLSSSISGYVSQSINPTINNQVGDIADLPVLDLLADYRIYLNRVETLYDRLFASMESNLEYSYEHLSPEYFEVEEARIRDEIDREIFAHFSRSTVAAIREEIGSSPFDYPAWDGASIPDGFAEAYQEGDSVLALSHHYALHPDGILAIKDRLGLVHRGQRQNEAFKHLSWAVGVLLGRFDPWTGGLVDLATKPDTRFAHSHGLLYLSALDDMDGIQRTLPFNAGRTCVESLRNILVDRWGVQKATELWREISCALVDMDGKRDVGEWLRLCAFARHKEIYENRPIYFPLVSSRKNFFVWVNIHRWNEGTLNAVLANYLKPDLQILESRLGRLREEIQKTADKKRRNEMEDEVDTLDKFHDELKSFAAIVARLAQKGPAPELQEVEAPYTMDLDDGVMVNSAALRELTAPLWKDPAKWWENLANPAGKKDFDWSHLAMRYWPSRVFAKCKKDPSLAVAHSDYGIYKGRDLFQELHPVAAKKWKEQQKKGNELEF